MIEYMIQTDDRFPKGCRVRWVLDEHHETRGSFAYETDEETRAAEDHELAKLEAGEWVALGAIVERECGDCGEWREVDSLWGIVVSPDESELAQFAVDHLDFGERH